MRTRKLRPTAFFRWGSFLALFGLLLALLFLSQGLSGFGLGLAVAVYVLLSVGGLELVVLPYLTRKAERAQRPPSPLLFSDARLSRSVPRESRSDVHLG